METVKVTFQQTHNDLSLQFKLYENSNTKKMEKTQNNQTETESDTETKTKTAPLLLF